VYNGKRKNMDCISEERHTVPMETPQSMLEEPSSGSKTTMYLHNKKIPY